MISLTSVCFSETYEFSDPDLLEYGPADTVIFINHSVVYIDGGYYKYSAKVGDFDYVMFTQSGNGGSRRRRLYEWNSIEGKTPYSTLTNPHPEIPICIRTADGETFDSMTAAMHHILGYIVRGEAMPILVDLDD